MTNTSDARGLPELAPGQSLGIALGITVTPNLRDLGGYKTHDDATVVRGRVYRSDMFSPLQPEEIKSLERLALKTVYDLRTAAEVELRPDTLPSGIHYTHLDVLADTNTAAPAQLETLLSHPKMANALLGGGKMDAVLTEIYRKFVFLASANAAYRALFLSLADEANAPGVFHCTAGKDRTGWAAAALLTLLGVPMETVMADYLQSNNYIVPQFQSMIDGFVAAGGDQSILLAIFGVKPEYLTATFDEMHKRYGTIENYFANALGISAAAQETLRELYLVKA